MSLDRELSDDLKVWLDASDYAPGHFIADPDFRRELLLGTILADVLSLGMADTDDGGTDLIEVNDYDGVFTATSLSEVLRELYTSATSASSDTFTDSGAYYAVDQVGPAFVALGVAIGGTSATVRNYSSNGYVADNDDLVVAIGKLDQGVVDAQADATQGIADAAAAQADADTALARVGAIHVLVDLTLGAEVANVVPVTVNVVDEAGAAVARAQRLLVQVFDGNMVQNAAVFRVAETGVGTEITATAQASLVIDTDAAGDAQISVTDVAGASGLTAYLLVTPISTATNQPGTPRLVPVGFDGV